MTATNDPPVALSHTSSRRTALCVGALAAALGTLSLRLSAAAQATPEATTASNGLLVQSFGQGSLFPTQGDVGVLPYTAILWDAAERGFFSHDAASGSAGVVSTEAVLSALAAADQPPLAGLMTLSSGDGGAAATWALRLVSGELGSDPGAVTYQGAPLSAEESDWLGTTALELPDAPQELGAGYLVIAGLSGVEATS